MAMRRSRAWAVAVVSGWCVAMAASTLPDGPVTIDGFTKVKSYNDSVVYTVDSAAASYSRSVYLIDLHGDRYQMGYAYGAMLASELKEVYTTFIHSLIGSSLIDKGLEAVLGDALDWQWNDYLSKQLPDEYKDEIRGIEDGGASVGQKGLGAIVSRVIVLANAPGDVKDFALILIREFKPHGRRASNVAKRLADTSHKFRGMCSMIGLWGSRTEGSKLYTGRNLDWNENTGINKYKAVTVYHPPGKIAHATLGYVGVWGALTGMSAAGLTVHEANLEEKPIGFDGFPWLLRLRYIMENAINNAQARVLWSSTNNTVGFNHMIGSAADAKAYAAGVQGAVPAMIMETMYNYTAFFSANDPREQSATYTNNKTGSTTKIGFPLEEAVWRTNHGFDPIIRENYLWSQDPASDSLVRYFRIHDAIVDYAAAKKPIGLFEAINITFMVGDKGLDHPLVCENNTNGTNVISAAYSPSELLMAAAWERNNGTAWRPATCSSYLLFNMSRWF